MGGTAQAQAQSPATAGAQPAARTPSRQIDLKFTKTQQQGMAKLERDIKDLVVNTHGKRRSINEVESDNGKVVEALPLPSGLEVLNAAPVSTVKGGVSAQGVVHAAAVYYKYGCEYGSKTRWTCLYQNSNFNGLQKEDAGPGNGRILRFQSAGSVQDLGKWNFRDQTSSWVNTTKNLVRVGDIPAGGDCNSANILWEEDPETQSGYVGRAANDHGDCIFINGLW